MKQARRSLAILVTVLVLCAPSVAYADMIMYPFYPTDGGDNGMSADFPLTAAVTLVASGLCMLLGRMLLREVRAESTAESGEADSERTGGIQP